MSVERILAAYRVIFCTLIVVASVQTLAAEPAHHVVLLASVEIAGALMLMWRRSQWVGAALLLLVFVGAQVMSAFEGEYPMRFLQYAASTLLVVLLDRTLSHHAADGHEVGPAPGNVRRNTAPAPGNAPTPP